MARREPWIFWLPQGIMPPIIDHIPSKMVSFSGFSFGASGSVTRNSVPSPSLEWTSISPSIERTIWPCRLEWAGRVIIDGSHNPQGVASACSYVRRYLKGEEVTLVLAMMKDKDCAECARMLRGVAARAYTASVGAPRSESPENLARMFGDGAVSAASPQEALSRAMQHPGIVLCTGSLYLAGEIRRML